ncbi:MgtC/SapB family protein [Marinoscillum furvescens]|uniref:Putative Mg2+ transporter-C (MgtC) family protein n=1 Tax=Marinoscillum furvescens DSM 4134 TaxID=1122208 RepID=A0A3D9L3A6_MARFU|nr:MgtC/SapB family protein [Marinoscillum furvescens]RED96561.1 putative Mg2+ transporter-C (MgtC) family protein [Marinoscillum furvescens DSM 4134]
MNIDTEEFHIIWHVLLASVLTMLVGLEREKANKAAGIRTNMIVGGFTCLTVLLINPMIDFLQLQNSLDVVETDPIRVLQAIVIGISFIGAGTIIKSRGEKEVRGITTAATLLYSVGIGICVAIDFLATAIALTTLIFVINYLLNVFTKKYTSLK